MLLTTKRNYLLGVVGLFILAFFLRQVFSGRFILEQFFSIGVLKIHYYGICLAGGAGAGYWLARKRSERFGITLQQCDDLVFWLIVGGFLGARIYHVFSSFFFYVHNPVAIVKVWDGGLSIYGAVFGGFLALYLYKKTVNLGVSLIWLCSWLTPSLIIGQIIGRFGNMFNYELYGYPTGMPWKMFVPLQFRFAGYERFAYFHPLFLYEIVANGLVLVLLCRLEKNGHKSALFIWYLLLYNTVRFCLEFLRLDSVFIGHFRQNAVVSLLVAVVAALYLTKRTNHAKIS